MQRASGFTLIELMVTMAVIALLAVIAFPSYQSYIQRGIRSSGQQYLMDLVQVAILPGVSAELKRNAEDQLLARLPQLPLGQKITLARRGPARVAGALLAEGHGQVVPIVLDNPYMTEAQILRALAREKLPLSVIPAIVQHRKWSITYNIRLALVRHPSSPLGTILSYLPELTVSDLRELAAPGIVPENLRKYLQAEVQRRMRASEKTANRTAPAKDTPASNSK